MGNIFSKQRNSLEVPILNPMVFYSRFPHISEQIFKQLDEKSLQNSREVAKSWQECIDDSNLLWIEIVKEIGGNEAFQLACRKGHSKMVEMLIQNPVKFNIELNAIKTYCGKTAFHWACNNGHLNAALMPMKHEPSFSRFLNTILKYISCKED